jgi:hypothetical protein
MPRTQQSSAPPRRRVNPNAAQWLGIAGVVVGATVIGVGVWDHFFRFPKKLRPATELPPGLEGGGYEPEGGGYGGLDGDGYDLPEVGQDGESCGNPTLYPGFVWQGDACVPSPLTPAGIYVTDGCDDFIFVQGDVGPQPEALDNALTIAAGGGNTDPTTIVTNFLNDVWPDCSWPPANDAPARIKNMWMALSLIAGRRLIELGGRSLGATDAEASDVAIGERFRDLGLDDFDQSVVPDLEVPGVPEEPEEPEEPGGNGGGLGGWLPPDKPSGGLIDVGGPTGPKGKPQGWEEPTPPCASTPYRKTRFRNTPEVSWTQSKVATFDLFTPPAGSGTCKEYEIRFGVCVKPNDGTFGLLDAYLAGDDSVQSVLFSILDNNGNGIPDFSSFRRPVLWKQQYKCRVTITGNSMKIVFASMVDIDDSTVDPCKTNTARWPKSPTDTFRITDVDGEQRSWYPYPIITLGTEGKTLNMRMQYSGLPQFININGTAGGHPQRYGRGRLDRTNSYNVATKVWALGKK